MTTAPHETAGWVLDFLESAARALAVEDPARAEGELSRRIDHALAQLYKASLHALRDPSYASWMGDDAWSSFTTVLDEADAALGRARRSRQRDELWRHYLNAVEHVTCALSFARVLWSNLPPDSAAADRDEAEA
jgi:hypothetical protein